MGYDYANTDQYILHTYPLSVSYLITIGNTILYTTITWDIECAFSRSNLGAIAYPLLQLTHLPSAEK